LPGQWLHLYCSTGLHDTNWVIACFLICNVICATDDLNMVIIMLDRLYFMLSCWLTPTDAAPMQQRGQWHFD
jgi:hypothetical protein